MRSDAFTDVAFTPDEVRPCHVAVVIDVLRATSTIAAALDAGYQRVLCVARIQTACRLRGPGRMLAGERGCRRISGFDFGNSPEELRPVAAGELVLCTTNGTPAILTATQAAERVLMASLLNLEAAIQAIPSGADLTIVCAGTGGEFALEDAYVAGRIVARRAGRRSDAARAAEQLASAYTDSYRPLAESANARVLRATQQSSDIDFCARESVLDVVPHVRAAQGGVADVSAAAATRVAA